MVSSKLKNILNQYHLDERINTLVIRRLKSDKTIYITEKMVNNKKVFTKVFSDFSRKNFRNFIQLKLKIFYYRNLVLLYYINGRKTTINIELRLTMKVRLIECINMVGFF